MGSVATGDGAFIKTSVGCWCGCYSKLLVGNVGGRVMPVKMSVASDRPSTSYIQAVVFLVVGRCLPTRSCGVSRNSIHS